MHIMSATPAVTVAPVGPTAAAEARAAAALVKSQGKLVATAIRHYVAGSPSQAETLNTCKAFYDAKRAGVKAVDLITASEVAAAEADAAGTKPVQVLTAGAITQRSGAYAMAVDAGIESPSAALVALAYTATSGKMKAPAIKALVALVAELPEPERAERLYAGILTGKADQLAASKLAKAEAAAPVTEPGSEVDADAEPAAPVALTPAQMVARVTDDMRTLAALVSTLPADQRASIEAAVTTLSSALILADEPAAPVTASKRGKATVSA